MRIERARGSEIERENKVYCPELGIRFLCRHEQSNNSAAMTKFTYKHIAYIHETSTRIHISSIYPRSLCIWECNIYDVVRFMTACYKCRPAHYICNEITNYWWMHRTALRLMHYIDEYVYIWVRKCVIYICIVPITDRWYIEHVRWIDDMHFSSSARKMGITRNACYRCNCNLQLNYDLAAHTGEIYGDYSESQQMSTQFLSPNSSV